MYSPSNIIMPIGRSQSSQECIVTYLEGSLVSFESLAISACPGFHVAHVLTQVAEWGGTES